MPFSKTEAMLAGRSGLEAGIEEWAWAGFELPPGAMAQPAGPKRPNERSQNGWNAEAVPRDTEWREVACAHFPSQNESALHPFVLLQHAPTMCEVRQKMPCSMQACAMIQTASSSRLISRFNRVGPNALPV
jgi:hypothetical protein